MTYTKLNLANELNNKIKELDAKLYKYQESFTVVAEDLNAGRKTILVQISLGLKTAEYPLEEFAEFLSSRIEKTKLQLEEVVEKFEQL